MCSAFKTYTLVGIRTRDFPFYIEVNTMTTTTLPGDNPTIASYNASVVNFCSSTGSLASFENKNIFFVFEKRSSLLQRWRCSCKLKKDWLQGRPFSPPPEMKSNFRYFYVFTGDQCYDFENIFAPKNAKKWRFLFKIC
jgi:hypothetical protein